MPSLNLFASLVSQVTLSATNDDFLAQATMLDTARTELLAAMAEADGVGAIAVATGVVPS